MVDGNSLVIHVELQTDDSLFVELRRGTIREAGARIAPETSFGRIREIVNNFFAELDLEDDEVNKARIKKEIIDEHQRRFGKES